MKQGLLPGIRLSLLKVWEILMRAWEDMYPLLQKKDCLVKMILACSMEFMFQLLTTIPTDLWELVNFGILQMMFAWFSGKYDFETFSSKT